MTIQNKIDIMLAYENGKPVEARIKKRWIGTAYDNGKWLYWSQRTIGRHEFNFAVYDYRLAQPPIYVGDHVVSDVSTKGFQVGCTFVPWETFDAIADLRP